MDEQIKPTGVDTQEQLAEGSHQVSSAQEEPTFEIDGQKYTMTEIKRWRDTRPNLEKYYYTKMNEVSQREKQVQQATALYDYLSQRPDIAQKMLELVNQGEEPPTQRQGETPDEYLDRLERIERQLQGVTAKFQEQEQRRIEDEHRRMQSEADAALSSELNRLKEKYGSDKLLPFDEQQVLLEAYNSGNMDLEKVYKQIRNDAIDVEKLKQQAVQEYLGAKKSAQVPRTPHGGSGGIPSFGGQAPKTLVEARRSAMQRLLGRREGE